MNKTPVSILQEMTVSRKLPLPDYNFEEKCDIGCINRSFVCTVKIGSMFARGVGISKQNAKHDSASNMLKKLNCFVETPLLSKTAHASSTFINYVGKLNEFAAANRLPYADYELVSATSAGKFVMKCTFNGFTTLGVATTKKEAKQNAASNMLSSDNIKDPNKLLFLQSTKPIVNKRMDETDAELKAIYKKYQSLSITNRESICKISERKDSKPVPKQEREILTEYIENTTDLADLEEMCKERGLKYDVEIIADMKNVLLVLKEKSSKLTVLEDGKTYEEALLNAVKSLLIIFITIHS